MVLCNTAYPTPPIDPYFWRYGQKEIWMNPLKRNEWNRYQKYQRHTNIQIENIPLGKKYSFKNKIINYFIKYRLIIQSTSSSTSSFSKISSHNIRRNMRNGLYESYLKNLFFAQLSSRNYTKLFLSFGHFDTQNK